MIDPKKRRTPGNRPIMHELLQTQTIDQRTTAEDHTAVTTELDVMLTDKMDMQLTNRPDMDAKSEQLIHPRNKPDGSDIKIKFASSDSESQSSSSQVHRVINSRIEDDPNSSLNRDVAVGAFKQFSPVRRVRKSKNNKLTAMLQVRNEQGRYLEEVLQNLSEFVDEIVIVDDASTDGTPDLCRAFPKVVRLDVLEKPLFAEEWRLRNTLWQSAVSTCPDWLLSVDADELYSNEAKKAIRKLIDQDYADWFAFRFYDMWGGRTHYREDDLWSVHKRHTSTLVRYMPGYPYFYPEQNHHVPRLPVSCTVLPGVCTELKVQHLGWAGSLEDRVRKYLRYKRIDPHGEWGNPAQYESILDPEPNLLPWKEET